ncbi:NUDIX hydrolase [Streptomyces yaizuensis]|uniref:NUDIX hydrolase n=1 Tax=Streptomyces yaizuensis TaxID=2989713 RepID=A0ABQ5NX95_9ACTN|nr:NUDIX hydrolase [Streptomyces sp. YSPA8]GLF95009.1 NUDIX hydrolase [Streptomyces sp. YSPA8]
MPENRRTDSDRATGTDTGTGAATGAGTGTGPGPGPLAVDERGNALLAFLPGAEDTPPGGAPVTVALVVMRHGGRILLVHDRYRDWWELPGGGIEPGEIPRRAAARELWEESGQRADGELRFAGWARFLTAPARRTEYGALFTGGAARREPFRVNAETTGLHWWDPAGPPPGRAAALDLLLVRLTG